MGIFSRRRPRAPEPAEIIEPEDTKAVVPAGRKSFNVSDGVRDTLLTIGGWPFGNAYGQLYRKQPAVRAVVDFRARNVAHLNLKMYERLANNDRSEIVHPMIRLLRRPNYKTSRFRFMFDLVADIDVYDRAYWLMDQPFNPRWLVRLPPGQVLIDSITTVDGTVITVHRRNGQIIPDDRLVKFVGYSPDGDDYGVPPLETLRRTLAEEWSAMQAREAAWRNGSRVPGAIERPADAPEWSDEARQRFRTEWESMFSGSGNAGRTPILEDGMRLNGAGFSFEQQQYIEGRKLTQEEVARVYGVPAKLLGMGDDSNANIESFHRQLYQDVLGPLLRRIQDDIELQLLPKFETDRDDQDRLYIEFNLAAKLAGSFEEQTKALTTAVGVPHVAINEARARQNLPRIDDPAFDRPIQPMNVIYGGQPAETVPTADRASPASEMPTTPDTRALPTPRTKAVPTAVLARRQDAADKHARILRRHFTKQHEAVAEALTSKTVDDARTILEEERWNSRLAADLYAAAVPLARRTGKTAAQQLAGVYDESLTQKWLSAGSGYMANAVNIRTRQLFEEALAADEPATAIRELFKQLTGSAAVRLGLTRATTVINFARNEAAKQSEAADGQQRSKTWIVTSNNSRHPHLHNETVPAGSKFSNGADHPGDWILGEDEVVGCQCLMQLS